MKGRARLCMGVVLAGAMLASCDADARGGAATNDAVPRAAAGVPSPAAPPRVARTMVAEGPAGSLRCPATLPGAAPVGTRIVGTAPGEALYLPIVTADASERITAELSGLAELEPDEGPKRRGFDVSYYDVDPTADQAHTLVCEYGRAEPPRVAKAALLIPLPPRAGGYRCTTERSLKGNPLPTRATCRPR